jgi:hypothetical protein
MSGENEWLVGEIHLAEDRSEFSALSEPPLQGFGDERLVDPLLHDPSLPVAKPQRDVAVIVACLPVSYRGAAPSHAAL